MPPGQIPPSPFSMMTWISPIEVGAGGGSSSLESRTAPPPTRTDAAPATPSHAHDRRRLGPAGPFPEGPSPTGPAPPPAPGPLLEAAGPPSPSHRDHHPCRFPR